MREEKKHTGVSQRYGSRVDTVVVRSDKVWNKGAHEKALPTSGQSTYDFLKERLIERPAMGNPDIGVRIDEEKSIDNVFSSIHQYLKLLGVEMVTKPTGRFMYDVNAALIELNEHITERDVFSNLELKSDVLCVYLARHYKVFEYSFVFLPICSVEKMPTPVADAFVDFVAYYARTQGVQLPSEHEDFCYHIYEDEWYFEEEEEDPLTAMTQSDYMGSGRYGVYFSRIAESNKSKEDILEILSLIKTECKGKDLELISCMDEGLAVLSSGCITSYDYNPDMNDYVIQDDYVDYGFFDVSRNYAICWSLEDAVTLRTGEYINSIFHEVPCYGVCESVLLTSNTNQIFKKSKYPKRFENWFFKFIDLLENYGKDK